jgi:hypothetical protein
LIAVAVLEGVVIQRLWSPPVTLGLYHSSDRGHSRRLGQ